MIASALKRLVQLKFRSPYSRTREARDLREGAPTAADSGALALIVLPDGADLVHAGTRVMDVLLAHSGLFLSSKSVRFMPSDEVLEGGVTYTLHHSLPGVSGTRDGKAQYRRSSMEASSNAMEKGPSRGCCSCSDSMCPRDSAAEISSQMAVHCSKHSHCGPAAGPDFGPLLKGEGKLPASRLRQRKRGASVENLPDIFSFGLCQEGIDPAEACSVPQVNSSTIRMISACPCCNISIHVINPPTARGGSFHRTSIFSMPPGSHPLAAACPPSSAHQSATSRRLSLALGQSECCVNECLAEEVCQQDLMLCSSHGYSDYLPGFSIEEGHVGPNPLSMKKSISEVDLATMATPVRHGTRSLAHRHTSPITDHHSAPSVDCNLKSSAKDRKKEARSFPAKIESVEEGAGNPHGIPTQVFLHSPLAARKSHQTLRPCGLIGCPPVDL